MNGPLDAITPDWPLLSRLLDEALDLPADHRDAWVAAQQQVSPEVRATLARLLAAPLRSARGDFHQTLPTVLLAEFATRSGDRAATSHDLHSGAAVGPWRLLYEIGAGGMGMLWLAQRSDGELKRRVALKLPRRAWTRERDILATLEHPGIARLYDSGVDAFERPWLALEYVRGRPVDVHCREASLSARRRV